MGTEDSQHNERIAALEIGQEQMFREIKDVKDSVDKSSRDNRATWRELAQEMRASHEQLRADISRTHKTSWPAIAIFVTIGLGFLAAIGHGYVRDYGRTENDLHSLEDSFIDHISDGHPSRVEAKIDGLSEVVDERFRFIERAIYDGKGTRREE